MGHRRAHHLRIHLGRRRARRRGAHGVRGRRREAVDLFVPGRGAARIRPAPPGVAAEVRGRRAEVRSGVVYLFVPLGTGDPACGRPGVSRAGYLSQHPCGRYRKSDPSRAGRCRPEPDRSLGTRGSRRPAGHRRLARAVRRRRRDQPRSEACPAHSGRDQDAGRQRRDDRQQGRPPAAALWRHAGAGAAARQCVRCRDPGAEARRHSGRRRRPPQADRAHRDHRPDEPRRRAAAAAGRSGAGGGAEEPAVRP